MNFIKEIYIRTFCSLINKRLQAMDDRPDLTRDVCDEIKRELAPHAKYGDADFEVLFSFFKEKKFVRSRNPDERPWLGEGPWDINTRFDDEWAINVFAENVEALATGVYKLDDILKGGLRVHTAALHSGSSDAAAKGNACKKAEAISVVLQGRPGNGKTTTALLMLSNFACQGYSSVYLSAEQRAGSLRRILQRYCLEFEPDSGLPGLYLGQLRSQPRSDAIAEHERQAKLYREVTGLPKEFRQNLQELLAERELKPNAKFFVLSAEEAIVKEGEASQFTSTLKARIRQLTSEGVHGIFIVTPELSQEGKAAPVNPGGVFAPSPDQFLSWYDGFQQVIGFSPSWIAIDSITAFETISTRVAALMLQKSHPYLSKLFLTERVTSRDETPSDLETACDMLIELGERNVQISSVSDSPSNYMQRYLEIKKFRSSPFHRGKHPMAIKSGTVKVYRSIAILLKVTGNTRRKIEKTDQDQKKRDRLDFGLAGLDGPHGLNDSVSPGSFTVLQGPPGTYKTAICNYFLTADFRASKSGQSDRARSLLYTFSADKRAIVHGMRNFVSSDDGRTTSIFEDGYLDGSKKEGRPAQHPLLEIHDIKAGFMFPEAFVEDLLDTLRRDREQKKEEKETRFVTRIVFDSFDAIQAAYPIMRMDQFFWKVISQICWDFEVSALLKVSLPPNSSSALSDAAASLVGIADNILETTADNRLRILATEHKVHNNRPMEIEPTMIRASTEDAARIWLRVR